MIAVYDLWEMRIAICDNKVIKAKEALPWSNCWTVACLRHNPRAHKCLSKTAKLDRWCTRQVPPTWPKRFKRHGKFPSPESTNDHLRGWFILRWKKNALYKSACCMAPNLPLHHIPRFWHSLTIKRLKVSSW